MSDIKIHHDVFLSLYEQYYNPTSAYGSNRTEFVKFAKTLGVENDDAVLIWQTFDIVAERNTLKNLIQEDYVNIMKVLINGDN